MIEKRAALRCWVALLSFALLAQSVHAILPGPIGGNLWVAQGAAPVRNTDVAVTGGEAAGAVQGLAIHPTNPDIIFIGAVNGGIWRTTNATASSPTWMPLTDLAQSLSIASLEFDPTDPSHNTLVAGLGSYSSLGREGSAVHGVLRTTDGGNSWSYFSGEGVLANKNISGVIARGNTIVVSVDEVVGNLTSTFGIYRSTNAGVSFQQVSSSTGLPSGLPYGRARSLMSDPTNSGVFYTVLLARNGGTNGVYKSTDVGATWFKVSNTAMDNLIATCGEDLVRISASVGGIVCMAVADTANSSYTRVFRSLNGGSTWSDMGLVTTIGSPVVFAVLADPVNTNLVYVAGGYPFRGDFSQPPGSQWSPIYGVLSSTPPNSGTTNNTLPHSDARNMRIDLNGNLILVCDGGIYRRSNPQSNQGGWSSINGNLQVGEMHNIAYDTLFQVSVAGTQDVGTQRQRSSNSNIWNDITGADGGDVGIDTTSLPGYSLVYLANEGFIGSFSRFTFAGTLNLVSNIQPALTVTGGGAALQGQFVTPVKLNSINPSHLVIAGANSIYESLDQGATIAEIGSGKHVGSSRNGNGFAYGGSSGGINNTDVLYAAASSGVLVRTNGTGSLSSTPTPFPGATPNDVALLPTNWPTVFVIDTASVFMSTNAGATWTNITGNLTGAGSLRCVRTGPTNKAASVLVGTDAGVYVSSSPNFGFWSMIGTNLPYAPVFDMEYNQAANVLLVGTLGRGAWMITNVSSAVFVSAPPSIGTQPQSQSVLIDSTASFSVSVGGTPTFAYQWRKFGAPIAGATNATLLVSLAQPTDAGNYDVVVSNSLNNVTSLTATLTVTGSPPANCAMSAPTGLISWWTADGTASDRVGVNHGMLVNGVVYTTGRVNQAFSVDGTSSYVSIPDSPNLEFSGSTPYTLEAWVFRTSSTLPFHVLGKRDTTSAFSYQMGYDGSSPSVPINSWTHLADSYDGSTYRRYVNGVLSQSYATSNANPPTKAPLEIGASGPYMGFQGLIDEVRIYNRTLTASEILAVYLAGTNGMCPPTPLMITSPLSYNKTNGFVLNASLRSSQSYRIQANTNLTTTNWLTLTNFTANTAPVFHFTNNTATNFPQRFYRIVSP